MCSVERDGVRSLNHSIHTDTVQSAIWNNWAEYFQELLSHGDGMEDLAILDDEEPVLSFDYLGDEDGPPSIEEIEESIN